MDIIRRRLVSEPRGAIKVMEGRHAQPFATASDAL